MSGRDLLRVGGSGLRSRPLRVVLSALGIAVGIAAMVAVIGISSSSRAELDHRLDALGTNLLRVAPGTTMDGKETVLPRRAATMIRNIGPVEEVAETGRVKHALVYRNEKVPAAESNGIAVYAASPGLLPALRATLAHGHWPNAAQADYPAVVLGADSAARLGLSDPPQGTQVLIGGGRFTVVGVLDTVELAPELDSAALVGWPAAQHYLRFDGHATTVWIRAREDAVTAVRDVLAATADPEHPEHVKVARPSDALTAKQAGEDAFTGLLLGVGAVALLVGGIGVANTMVISVLERRSEIGLRRALGATRGAVRGQFLVESLLLAVLGGAGGVVLGTAVTAGFAATRGWPFALPLWVPCGALGATSAIGALAGIYPAVRAARMAPTAALAAH
ncbi:ABC transporter permease [Streptacidiphilus sp. ASG 303]|uniref:ABC transporter permease n=1 Tax=Streptacidiphilus sp. ASG 303 TaxID=2896847 RepID=UPI0027E05C23|nr:ABC transporter permease [Streptacidiphilus sp. ASG 303]